MNKRRLYAILAVLLCVSVAGAYGLFAGFGADKPQNTSLTAALTRFFGGGEEPEGSVTVSFDLGDAFAQAGPFTGLPGTAFPGEEYAEPGVYQFTIASNYMGTDGRLYRFDGWSVSPADAAFTAEDAVYPESDVSLTANWTKLYTATFDYGVEEVADYSFTAPSGTAVDFPADEDAPEKTGYVFGGWSVAGEKITALTFEDADITVDAIWLKIHTATFDYAVEDAENYTFNGILGDAVSFPVDEDAPEKAGYVFGGWSVAGEKITTLTFEDADITVDAIWFKIHTATFDYDVEDAENYTSTGILGDAVTFPADEDAPEKAGYVFGGWSVAGEKITTLTFEDADITVNAIWFKIHTATFDYDVEDAENYTFTGILGDAVSFPAADAVPEKPGYRFGHWVLEGTTDPVSSATFADGDVRFVAVWDVVYTAGFDFDIPDVEDYSHSGIAGEAVRFPETIPEKSGYRFAHWVLQGESTPVSQAQYQDSNLQFVAVWNVVYTATFDFDIPEVEDYTHSGIAGEAVLFPAAAPEKSGYRFGGWLPEGAAEPATTAAYQDSDLQFTAIWHKLYTASFDYQVPGTPAGTFSGISGESFDLPTVDEIPAKSGYRFRGWVVSGNTELVTSATFATANLSFTAVWDKLYTVTFDYAISGENPLRLQGISGETIQCPAIDKEKAGYDFVAWRSGSQNVTQVTLGTADVVVTAKWTARDDTRFYVIHMLQTIDGSGYEPDGVMEMETGTTDTAISSLVLRKEFAGFTQPDNNCGFTATGTISGNEDTVLRIYYTRNKYNVVFKDADNAALKVTKQVIFGDTIPSAESQMKNGKAGYRLVGWSYLGNPVGLNALGTLDTAGDREYTLVWAKLYTATFRYNVTGSTPVTYSNVTDTVIQFPSPAMAPLQLKPGYAFSGWKLGEQTVTQGIRFTNSDLVFDAIWTPKTDTKYTVKHYGQSLSDSTVYDVLLGEQELTGTTDAPSLTAAQAKRDDFTGFSFLVGNNGESDTVTVKGDGTAQLRVYYSRNSYTMTFTDPLDAQYVETVTVPYQGAITPPATLPTAQEGYELDGWKYDGTTYKANALGKLETLGDRSYEAVWGREYTISFDYGAGYTKPPVFKAKTGTTIVYPSDMLTVKPGYKPVWSVANLTVVGTSDVALTVLSWAPRSDVKYRARYIYESTEGSYTDAGVETVLGAVRTGTCEQAVALNDIKGAGKTGFTLDTVKSKPSFTITGDESQVFDVYYKRNRHKLVYKYNIEEIGTGTLKETVHKTYENYIFGAELPFVGMALKTGYDAFSGWTPSVSTMPNSALTLTGSYKLQRHKAIFKINGDPFTSVTYKYGDTIKTPATSYGKDYIFSGWTVSGTMGTADRSFNATLYVEYNVSVYAMGTTGKYGSPVTTVKKNGIIGTVVSTSESYKTGFVLDPAKDSQNILSGTVPDPKDGKLTLTAYFARKQYNATFKTASGSSTVKYYYGQTIIPPAAPHTADKTFTGWSPKIPATMPNAAQTFTAQYSAKALEKITVSNYPQSIVQGKLLNLSGTKLQYYYDNGTTKTVTITTEMLNKGTVTVSPRSFSKVGKQTATISYGADKGSFTVNVTARVPQKVEVFRKPTKMSYTVGQALILAGAQARVYYNNDTQETIDLTDSRIKVTGYDAKKVGNQTLTVTFTAPGHKALTTTLKDVVVKAVVKRLKGDVNGDGYITSLDATLIRAHYLGKRKLSGTDLTAADINGDGLVTSLDLTLVRRHYLKIQAIKQ